MRLPPPRRPPRTVAPMRLLLLRWGLSVLPSGICFYPVQRSSCLRMNVEQVILACLSVAFCSSTGVSSAYLPLSLHFRLIALAICLPADTSAAALPSERQVPGESSGAAAGHCSDQPAGGDGRGAAAPWAVRHRDGGWRAYACAARRHPQVPSLCMHSTKLRQYLSAWTGHRSPVAHP